jgi:hypothetical protein
MLSNLSISAIDLLPAAIHDKGNQCPQSEPYLMRDVSFFAGDLAVF